MSKLHPGQIDSSYENLMPFFMSYGIIDFSFQAINQGLENTSFKIEAAGKQYVLRVYRNAKKSDEDIAFELDFQNTLRGEGIPIPEIYPTVDGKTFSKVQIEGKSWQAILMKYVEGSSIVDHYTPQLIQELAEYQTKMHFTGLRIAEVSTSRPQTKWNDLHDTIGKAVKDLSLYDDAARSFIERLKAYAHPLSPDLPHGYNHLDLDLDGNVITKDDHIVAILDFDDLEYSPVVVCLGYTCWEVLFTDGPEKLHEYLAEYTKHRQLSDLEWKTLPHIILFRNYVVGIIELLFLKDQDHFGRILRLEKEIPNLDLRALK